MSESALIRTLKLSIVEGSLSQIFLMWTTGSVLVGYMLHFGATPSQIALVSSVPLLAQLFSPLAAWWATRLPGRRIFATSLALFGRCLWLVAAVLPSLAVDASLMPVYLLILVGLSSVFQAALVVVWTDWMGDVVPEDKRGRYFGIRTGLVGVIGMIGNLAAGRFLDAFAAPESFQIILGAAVVVSIIASGLLFLHHEPVATRQPIELRRALSLPWLNPNFRQFLTFAGFLFFGMFLSAALVTAYFLDVLDMSFTQVAYWTVIASGSALVTTPLWGRLADRIGNRPVLQSGIVIMAVGFPTCWILADLRHNLNYIWLSAVVDAIAWGATGPAIFNLALFTAPRQGRLTYLAMYSVTTGLFGFIGGALAGPLFETLQRIPHASWSGYHSLFVVSGLLRLASVLLLRRVKETKVWNPRPLFRHLRAWRRLGFPWR
ncbi:MAG: MFS transporter [Trueperaceae bacterium]|nr:MAG: MFS transporter [Trueperaceae bacterium]